MARAQLMLANPTSENIRYIALELRLWIEALTYEKLRAFSDVIPEAILRTWQPPQAVKALLEFEPMGDRSFSISIELDEGSDGESKRTIFAGQHTALRLNWLRKHYNKLGGLLHAPSLLSAQVLDVSATTAYLHEVVADLAEPLLSTITGGGSRQVFSFECALCQKLVVNNKASLAKAKKAVCFNPQCEAEYFVTMNDDEVSTVQLQCTEFDCHECKSPIAVENRKLAVGFEFSCESCGKKQRIAKKQWLCGPA